MLSRLFQRPIWTKLGIFIYQIPAEDIEKGNKTFPLPKDSRIHQFHESNAKAYCLTYTNPSTCESAGWALNKNIDQDMVCSWSVETPTAEAAKLIRAIGKGAESGGAEIGTVAKIFTDPLASVTEAAGETITCHHMMLPWNMTIEEFYKQEKEERTVKARPPKQVVQLVQIVPQIPTAEPVPAPSPVAKYKKVHR